MEAAAVAVGGREDDGSQRTISSLVWELEEGGSAGPALAVVEDMGTRGVTALL